MDSRLAVRRAGHLAEKTAVKRVYSTAEKTVRY